MTKEKAFNYFPRISKWAFLVLLLGISYAYNYHDLLLKDPQSIHLWRQCDCLSITMNFSQDDNPLFKPSIHNLSADGTGKTISDFPLIYYIIGRLWKVFGQQEWMYRLIVIALFFSALFFFFRYMEHRFKDSILAILSTLFIFTSPTLVYYTNNFLMDVPAFSIALIAFTYFLRFIETSDKKHFIIGVLLYTLAGLLKVSALLSFFIFLGIFVLEIIGFKIRKAKPIFDKSFKTAILFLLPLALIFVWVQYAQSYNSNHNSGIFLVGILPIWDVSNDHIERTLHLLNHKYKNEYFNLAAQIFLIICALTVILTPKKGNWINTITIIAALGGIALFFILFWQAMGVHDYYAINLFIIFPILVQAFFSSLKELKLKQRYFYPIYLILVALVVHGVLFTGNYLEKRFAEDNWQNDKYFKYFKAFRDITPHLESYGIEKDDKIISISDNSINISLYLMNQKGWTNYGIKNDSVQINKFIKMGAKYIMTYDKKAYDYPKVAPYLQYKIGEFKNIEIFDIQNIKDESKKAKNAVNINEKI